MCLANQKEGFKDEVIQRLYSVSLLRDVCNIFVFIVCRCTILHGEDSLIPFYYVIHTYTWLTLFIPTIYNPFKTTFDRQLERERRLDGTIYINPFLCFAAVMCGCGYAFLPFWFTLREQERYNPLFMQCYFPPTLLIPNFE